MDLTPFLPVLAGMVAIAVWIMILARWQTGIYLFLVYMPFSGAIEHLYHDTYWPVLLKDVLFVLPAYLGYASVLSQRQGWSLLPVLFKRLLVAFIVLVVIQTLNPGGMGLTVGLVGLKVWLFYVPMLLLGADLIDHREQLIRLCRLMIILAWIPCVIAIIEWMTSLRYGYVPTMRAIYGEAAESATQGFVSFDIGVMRIPSTFSFITQFLNYALAMMVPAFALTQLEHSRARARFAFLTLGLLCIGGFLSGARAAFMFVPMLVMLIYWLVRGARGSFTSLFLVVVSFLIMFRLTGIKPEALFEHESTLTESYAHDVVIGLFVDAVEKTWVGMGTGTSTGAARYVVAAADADGVLTFKSYENYYAKAVYELGVAGLFLITALHGLLALYTYRIMKWLRDPGLVQFAGAVCAMIIVFMIYDWKGAIIDMDPVNALFWLFAGITLKLPHMELEAWHAEPPPLANVSVQA